MSGYTTGPWKQRDDESVCIVDANGNAIAYTDTFLPREECIANARLMAASTELLDALKSAETFEASLIGEWADFWDVAPQPLIDKLMKAQELRNAAIARADGL